MFCFIPERWAGGSTFLQCAGVLFSLLLATWGGAAEPVPLSRAHAHNDYEHTRPLLDALDQGFCSVEADIWLVEGRLLVAHDLNQVNPQRTLEALYLDPLQERVRRYQGRVFPSGPPFQLMIDVKSAAEPAYRQLRQVLAKYNDMLTHFTLTNTTTNAVTIILSGNRAAALIAAEPFLYVALDGRLPDLDTPLSPHLYPLISDNWQKHFTWRGEGPLPATDRDKLHSLVQRTHAQGRQIRFWAIPDSPAGWTVMQNAGVDLINTDRLAELRAFLLSPH